MRKLVGIIVFLNIFYSCELFDRKIEESKIITENRVGGCFKIGIQENIISLYPPSAIDVGTHQIVQQIFEGLVKLETENLTIVPSIAEKWSIDSSGTVYTFHIKKGVYFHDDNCFIKGKGRELTAKDVEFTFKNLCTPHPENLCFSMSIKDKVLGATEYFNAIFKGNQLDKIEGVTIKDDFTIEIKLTKPFNLFLNVLATPGLSILAKESMDSYGYRVFVGTGPFQLAKGQPISNDSIFLIKNRNYHKNDDLGMKLPYLDSIAFYVIKNKLRELDLFKNNKLSFVHGLPSESIKEMVADNVSNFQQFPPKYILNRTPEMSTYYLSFNLNNLFFKNKKARQAINYAIDRNAIVENVLKGEAFAKGENGIVPPSFKGYDISLINGYNFDLEKARLLFDECGYKKGSKMPVIKFEINSGGQKNVTIATELQKQLMQNLGLKVEIDVVPMAKKIEDEIEGKADFFRNGWVADFPDPENFLCLFYGGNLPKQNELPAYPNTSRYRNKNYDMYYENALSAKTKEEATVLFQKAEQILMDDAIIAVLYYGESYILIQSNVRNYVGNPMKLIDFSTIYFGEMVSREKE